MDLNKQRIGKCSLTNYSEQSLNVERVSNELLGDKKAIRKHGMI